MTELLSRLTLAIVVMTVACRPARQASDATAEAIVRQLADYHRDVKSLQVQVSQHMSLVSQEGAPQETTSVVQLVLQRPNQISVRETSGLGVDLVADGNRSYTVVKALKQFTETPESVTFNELLDDPLVSTMLGPGSMFVVTLLSDDPYAGILDGSKEVIYAGRETLAGKAAHRVRISQQGFAWEMWVSATGDPLVLQLRFDGQPASREQASNAGTKLRFEHWKVNADVPAEAFAFRPPDGMEQVPNVFRSYEDMLRGRPRAISPLVGRPAPLFESKLATGEPFVLADQLARHKVVMLDFWATWCGPCVREMPILEKVVRQYGNQGVALFAVNIGEDVKTIRGFLQQQKLDLPAVLDEDSVIGQRFELEGIPMLVLIDAKGVMQSVHVGYSPSLERTLKSELDALLAGKSLVE